MQVLGRKNWTVVATPSRLFSMLKFIKRVSQFWGILLFIAVGWLAFSSPDNSVIRSLRLAIEPTACHAVPANLFLTLPILYWISVFLFTYFSNPPNAKFSVTLKNSVTQMFRNATIDHPSKSLAATVAVLSFLLWYLCSFPIAG